MVARVGQTVGARWEQGTLGMGAAGGSGGTAVTVQVGGWGQGLKFFIKC